MKRSTIASLFLVTAVGCNAHPLKPTEMQHFGDDGGESGGESGGGESGDESGDGESGGEGDEGGFVPDCGGDRIQLDEQATSVVLVLDKSGSMYSNTWDHDGDGGTPEVTRWFSLHGVVESLVGQYADSIDFGAVLFPAADADHDSGEFAQACAMADVPEVPLAPNNAGPIVAGIPDRDDRVRGGTPTRQGILNALNHLVDVDEGQRAMILVTDGQANCVAGADPFHSEYDTELPLAVRSAYEDNQIPTYVVGIDIQDQVNDTTGVNTRQAINDVAAAGGVARDAGDRFYNVLDQVELAAALDEITTRVECTVALPSIPASPHAVVVTVDGEQIAQVDDCAGGEGWRFTSDTAPFNTIELCNATCEQFRGVGELETDYTCTPEG